MNEFNILGAVIVLFGSFMIIKGKIDDKKHPQKSKYHCSAYASTNEANTDSLYFAMDSKYKPNN
jgi:hypothetical protein